MTTSTKREFGSVRPLGRKKFQARYVGPDHERYSKSGFVSRGDASRFLAGVQTEISRGTWVSPKAPKAVKTADTFAEYAEKWMAKRVLTPRTRTLYQSQLDRFLLPTFGADRLDEIAPDEVQDWWDDLPSTPTQNAQVYSLFRTIMGTAESTGRVLFNPCKVKPGKVRRVKEVVILTASEVRGLAALLPERYRALVLIAAFCALRFGEITELRRSDFVNGRLHIRRGVTWVNGKRVIGLPKTEAGRRAVPVVPSLRKVLAEHILAFAEPGDDGLIFPAASGGHLSHSTLTSVFKKAKVAFGKPGMTLHHLRHTGAVLWAQDETMTLKDLMTLLGHETPDTAMIYQHVAEGKLDATALRLDAHFAA